MYADHAVLSAAAALEAALAADPSTARPAPDLAQLATTRLDPFP